MQVFHCDVCGHLIFFESLTCVHCGAAQAFLPDQLHVGVLPPQDQPNPKYRACAHRTDLSLCNFAIEASDPHHLCVSCRQTAWLPDPANPANEIRWAKIESAKRALYYTLAKLGLMDPLAHKAMEPRFALLADMPGESHIMTGHAGGLITLNVVEADDEERARRRLELHEPYRTLIGHLRHEIGHFYWDQLIANTAYLEPFRALFGDEREDYAQALQRHYDKGLCDAHWRSHFISAYATSHPWEDWAETWAHYLHMVDLLETAASYGTCITVPDLPSTGQQIIQNPMAPMHPDFSVMQAQWTPLTLLHNSLNRSLGHEDAYPFAIASATWDKLRFVHEVVCNYRQQLQTSSPQISNPQTSSLPT